MSINEKELELLTDLLNKMDDLDEADKTKIINSYIIADTASRTVALMMIKDRLEQINNEKNTGVLHI